MKTFRRLLCLLLVLLSLVTLVPMAAFASEGTDPTAGSETGPTEEPPKETEKPVPSKEITIKYVVGKKTLYTEKITIKDKSVVLKPDRYWTHEKKVYDFVSCKLSTKEYPSITVPAYDGTAAWTKKWEKTISFVYKAHKHRYIPSYNRTFHWNICSCGSTTNAVYHVDPAQDADKICTCGYVFSNNTQLTTLWLTNVRFDTPFNKDIREYTAKVVDYGYNDPTSTIITATPFDALATLTMPESRELKEGVTKFEFHLLAEDKTTAGTYTVTVLKPVKVGKNLVYTDGTTVHTQMNAAVKNKTAVLEIPEDVTAKMLELSDEGVSSLLFKTKFSKWSMQQLDLTLTGSFLTAAAEKTKADLKVETAYGTTLVIPHADLAALADGRESLTVRIGKDNSFAVLAGEESLPLSENVILNIPETK